MLSGSCLSASKEKDTSTPFSNLGSGSDLINHLVGEEDFSTLLLSTSSIFLLVAFYGVGATCQDEKPCMITWISLLDLRGDNRHNQQMPTVESNDYGLHVIKMACL